MIDIEGFKNYLYEDELSENTVTVYTFTLSQYARQYDEITKSNLIAYKKYLIENMSPGTVNLRITALMKYCKYKNISMALKKVKLPHKTYIDNVISEEQYETLISGLLTDQNYRWFVNIELLAKTGMRVSEAIRIRKKDLLSGSVTIPTKAHLRTIYFPKQLINELTPYIEDKSDNDLIATNRFGRQLTTRGYAQSLYDFSFKYGIPKEVMHPHSFRHFFAIEFLKRNNNIALLADVLGHGDVKITSIYLRQSQEQQKAAVDNAVNW